MNSKWHVRDAGVPVSLILRLPEPERHSTPVAFLPHNPLRSPPRCPHSPDERPQGPPSPHESRSTNSGHTPKQAPRKRKRISSKKARGGILSYMYASPPRIPSSIPNPPMSMTGSADDVPRLSSQSCPAPSPWPAGTSRATPPPRALKTKSPWHPARNRGTRAVKANTSTIPVEIRARPREMRRRR